MTGFSEGGCSVGATVGGILFDGFSRKVEG